MSGAYRLEEQQQQEEEEEQEEELVSQSRGGEGEEWWGGILTIVEEEGRGGRGRYPVPLHERGQCNFNLLALGSFTNILCFNELMSFCGERSTGLYLYVCMNIMLFFHSQVCWKTQIIKVNILGEIVTMISQHTVKT